MGVAVACIGRSCSGTATAGCPYTTECSPRRMAFAQVRPRPTRVGECLSKFLSLPAAQVCGKRPGSADASLRAADGPCGSRDRRRGGKTVSTLSGQLQTFHARHRRHSQQPHQREPAEGRADQPDRDLRDLEATEQQPRAAWSAVRHRRHGCSSEHARRRIASISERSRDRLKTKNDPDGL